MIRGNKTLVTIFLLFFSISLVAATENQPKTPKDTEVKEVKQQEEKNQQQDIAPVVPNLNNDQWRKDEIRYRIPKDFEFTQPLITYKEQQVA